MNWTVVADVVAAICMLGGSLLAFTAGVGLMRFPGLFSRMHTATKPQVLGLFFVLLGLGLRIRSWPAVSALVIVVIFQLLTSPVAAHMVGRAGHQLGLGDREGLVVDELIRDRAEADRAKADDGEEERRGG